MDDIYDEEEHSPEPSHTPSEIRDAHTSMLFGSKPIPPQKLRLLHPSPQHMNTLGNLYARNCDPMFKTLHIPSLEKLILHASNNFQEIPYGNYVEALLFAVYYCAVVSLRQEECLEYFQDRKEHLLVRYRSGTETALANADMLNTKELGTLQALVIFLVSGILTSEKSVLVLLQRFSAIKFAMLSTSHHRNAHGQGLIVPTGVCACH